MDNRIFEINPIKVKFTNVELGCLVFNISVGNQSFKDSFSEVFDPLLYFKYWLESIAIGAQQVSFNYNNEGNEIRFDLEQMAHDRCEFRITEYYNSKRVFIQSNIDRKQLVKEFYKGIFSFYFSIAFNSKEWEIDFMKSKICNFLKISENKVLNILMTLNRNQLINLFHLSDPTFTFGSETETDYTNKNLKKLLSKLNITSNKEDDKPLYWDVPEDYNNWKTNEKSKYLINFLNKPAYGYSGTKIIELKSDIIENYIK